MPSPPPGVWLASHIPAAAKPLRQMSALPCPEQHIWLRGMAAAEETGKKPTSGEGGVGQGVSPLGLELSCLKHKTENAIRLGKGCWCLHH